MMETTLRRPDVSRLEEPMLSIQSLWVSYNGHDILQDISLEVSAGEVLAVIGPNGAGKSTLIRAASGVLPMRAGKVFLAGNEIESLSTMERARLLAVVPQARELPGAFTVYQTVLLGRTPYLSWLGRGGRDDHAQVQQALRQTQTLELAERRVGELSGGEQQRVLLARALAQDTPILVMDEPTTHLDLEHQSSLLNFVRLAAARQKKAILMVLHDLNQAALYADRIALLEGGQVKSIGAPEEVLTSENLSAIYHIQVNVIPHPEYGTPLVLPDGRVAKISPQKQIAKEQRS